MTGMGPGRCGSRVRRRHCRPQAAPRSPPGTVAGPAHWQRANDRHATIAGIFLASAISFITFDSLNVLLLLAQLLLLYNHFYADAVIPAMTSPLCYERDYRSLSLAGECAGDQRAGQGMGGQVGKGLR